MKKLEKNSSFAQRLLQVFSNVEIKSEEESVEMTFGEVVSADGMLLRYPDEQGLAVDSQLEVIMEDGEAAPAEGDFQVDIDGMLWMISAQAGVIVSIEEVEAEMESEDSQEEFAEENDEEMEAVVEIFRTIVAEELTKFKSELELDAYKEQIEERFSALESKNSKLSSRLTKAAKAPAAKATEFSDVEVKPQMKNMDPKRARELEVMRGIFGNN